MLCRRTRSALSGFLAGFFCVSFPVARGAPVCAGQSEYHFAVAARDNARAEELRSQVMALSPKVHPDEATRLAECAYASGEQLRHDYRVFGPPQFHNFLVNTGIRKRGLCFQWAEDLLAQLDRLKLRTLELHWAEAYAGTLHEHNCVVVTARGQPFRTGIILDCWRHAGRLYWAPLATDHYPWIEDSRYARIARAKAAAASNRHVAFEMPVDPKPAGAGL